MGITAIILVTISVLFHATWNMHLKEESKNFAFVVSFNAAAAILIIPLAVWAFGIILSPSFLPVLPYLLASAACNALYYIFLNQAYKFGDFSIAYPVSRSTPIFVVTIAGLFFGEQPSLIGLAGIILVVAGCFLLPFGRLKNLPREFKLRSFLNKTMGFALLTALATAGYSLFDKFGSRPLYASTGIRGALGYMAFEWILTFLFILPMTLLIRDRAGILLPLVRNAKKVWLAAGLMTFSYGFVMIAYQLADVSYVVGFRQLSVVLGAVFGGLILKEKVSESRITGVLVIVAGLIMIALA